MILTFDLYTHKTKLYYIAEIISIVSIVIPGACSLVNFQPDWPAFTQVIIEVLIIICVFIMLAFVLIAGYGMLKTYVKDGELILDDHGITIDGKEISLTAEVQISFKLRPRTNRSGWRRTGNRIEVTVGCKTYNRLFSIDSYAHNDELLQLLNIWSENNVQYSLKYRVF